MEPIDTIEYKGYHINIYYDEYPENPREFYQPLGTMVCFHKRYNLGDINSNNPIHEVSDILSEFYDTDKIDDWLYEQNTFDFLMSKLENHAVILPLYLYDHSGITMNTTGFTCPWDSGKVGFIYVTFNKIKEEFSFKKLSAKRIKFITQCLINEVKEYDDYLTGRVYFLEVTDNDGEVINYGSYYGDTAKENFIVAAKLNIDSLINIGEAK